jgi:DNA-binding CsgD family transcriptional regulator
LEITLAGIASARRRGAERSWGAFLAGEAARRLRTLGRIAEAAEMLDEAHRMAPRGLPAASLHQERAGVELARGHIEVARTAIGTMAKGVEISLPLWEGQRISIAAEIELWDGQPDAALQLVTDTIAAMGEQEWVIYTAPLYSLGARAHADKAGRARVLKRDADVAEARAAAAALAERCESLYAATFVNGPPTPPCLAWRAQIAAELTRIDGSGEPGAWAAAREAWDDVGLVPESLYCAWREADALLAADAGDRGAARDLLERAHGVATDAGAKLMLDEIEALARRARIDLTGDGNGPGPDAGAAPSAAEAAGLTPREADVLALVAEGRTNREIGAELFISDKTASVHVSRILAKLDAANRGEAAAMARRLGVSVSRD